jgi:hypothetical protein
VPWKTVAQSKAALDGPSNDSWMYTSATIGAVRYNADITAGSLKVPESRIVAELLLERIDGAAWRDAIEERNVLQARSPATAIRLARLLRLRLETMDEDLWRLVANGSSPIATHACLAAAVKHSKLLGDFLDSIVREEFRIFSPKLTYARWDEYLDSCRARDPQMKVWNASTVARLRSTVFQILAQAGIIENTRTLRLQRVHISAEVLAYLRAKNEQYVLRCIEVGT